MKVPQTFIDSYDTLMEAHGGDHISDSPFRKLKERHWTLRDSMSTDDILWARGWVKQYDQAAYRKWMLYENTFMEQIYAEADRRGDLYCNLKYADAYQILRGEREHDTVQQKQKCIHWRNWWALYTKTAENIYKQCNGQLVVD